MADEDDEVVAKPKAKKKNPLVANKAKATAKKVIEKAAAKPVKGKATPAKKTKEEGKGRQPSEEMQGQRTELLALLKRRKNGLTSVECQAELGWTSAQVAATSFGLVNLGQLTKEKDPVSGRVSFMYAG
jgi:hypothetical protein